MSKQCFVYRLAIGPRKCCSTSIFNSIILFRFIPIKHFNQAHSITESQFLRLRDSIKKQNRIAQSCNLLPLFATHVISKKIGNGNVLDVLINKRSCCIHCSPDCFPCNGPHSRLRNEFRSQI